MVIIEPDLILTEDAPKDKVTHAQPVSAEQDLILGKPYALKADAHMQTVGMELDLLWGKFGTLNKDVPAHLIGIRLEVLMNEPDDWLLFEEEVEEMEATVKTASIKEDDDPGVKLQGPRVSHLTTQEGIKSLTFSFSPSQTLPKAAHMQCLPVVNTGMLANPEAKSGTDLVPLPPPHDLPPPDEAMEPPDKAMEPPDKAMEPPDKDPPEQIQVPAAAGELKELLLSEARQHVMWHNSQSQVHASEGKKPIIEAHGCPPDLLEQT
jgi:hypothetical protein